MHVIFRKQKRIMTGKILLVSDFDATLTKFDTTFLSLHACTRFNEGTEEQRKEIKEVWNERSKDYLAGYSKAYEDNLKLFRGSSNENRLLNFLKSLDEYNVRSRVDIANKHLLDDISTKNISNLVKEVVFQDNAKEVLQLLKEDNNVETKILSVNWFKPLLEESLKAWVSAEKIISSSTPILMNGEIDFGPVSTSQEKRGWIMKWKNEGNHQKCIYVGDSLTDIGALLEADYGILFGQNT
eukprot:TCONS_00047273-protein